MARWDDKTWKLNETLQKRDFVSRPNSSVPVLRPLTSRAFRNPFALTDPIGVTAYSEDFCWKPLSKPERIRTGTASGYRRNNPHPSQGFMVWRLPPGQKICENAPPKDKVKSVLSAQYKSTYRTDFLGIPQGPMMKQSALDPIKVPQCIHTEMRSNYREPVSRPEFRESISHHEAPKGIVPTVVQKHITNPETLNPFTTYERHFCGKSTDFASVLSSLEPEELQHFYKHLPEKEKMVVQTFWRKQPSPSGQGRNIIEPVSLKQPPAVLDRISVWPGPP